MMSILFWVILFCWIVTILRLLISSVSSDLLILRQAKQNRAVKVKRWHLPSISVLVPAYNEELTIIRALESIRANDYPLSKVEIIVINDGSSDHTRTVVEEYKRAHKQGYKIRLINRPNKGKARALNYALRHCVRGRLIVCLDADTYLNAKALRNAAQYFRDRNTVALSCYPDIIEDGTILGLIQRIEYIVGFRVKSGHTYLDSNYIISGTGSVFRRSILKRVSYYESNTLTEDLDLTMKIIASKRKDERIGYARNVVAYTEAVHTLDALLSQRLRWTYGRAQAYIKHSNLFFSRENRHNKLLTWFLLPFSLVQDISVLLSPFVNAYFLYFAYRTGSMSIMIGGVIALSAYLAMSIWSVEHISLKDKMRLTYYAPAMYILIQVIALADYYALIKVVIAAPGLRKSLKTQHFTWRSPERKQAAAAV